MTSPLGADFGRDGTEVTQYLARELEKVWDDFESRLDQVPLVRRLDEGTVTLDDYRELLLNLRQQVVEGGRWIALAASSMSIELFPVRSLLIKHAAEEHTDYQMLEQNYVSVGGDLATMLSQPKNIGSEAFSAFMFHQAAKPDPLDLFGAMFIIEGLGSSKAAGWAARIQELLGLEEEQVSFLAYHGVNDDSHYEKLRMILSHPLIDMALAERLVRTAKIVARLYALQLEEIGNI
ncbi:MAG: iron-containing redox enzyme family protein [Microthrixaceae bacterium]|nr:iron-containing redox enzyme family protein [Microthrixaceae bacterium]